MGMEELPEISGTSFNQKAAVLWLEQQSEGVQLSLTENVFDKLLSNAAQPKQSSGNACSKLCGFIQNCSVSASPVLKSFAFAQTTSIKLFNYFIEWNEQDAHRSMRLVLDYIVSSIMWNPDIEVGQSIKNIILTDSISVITLQSSRPSTKSSMIAIDHFLQKEAVYLGEMLCIYQRLREDTCGQEALWDSFISRIFSWMELQHVWTVAGKLLVTILTKLWYQDDNFTRHQPNSWHKFISSGLKTNVEFLEPIKIYVFIPLFKADPTSTLVYLKELGSLQNLAAYDVRGWNIDAMLWVALLEAGKKTGVVGEPGPGSKHSIDTSSQLSTHILEALLCHQSNEARAPGLSILVASPSTTKPYTSETLRLLRKYLPSFHEDVDPKIRYDVLGHSRNLVRRLQNSVDTLRKGTVRATKQLKSRVTAHEDRTSALANNNMPQSNAYLTSDVVTLREHEEFIEWYAGFLKDELVPTVSYQRHITSLRAMSYFLKLGLSQSEDQAITSRPVSLMVDDVWFRSILDLIVDPYDDVRETAASLLTLIQRGAPMSGPPKQINGLHTAPIDELRLFCRKANQIALQTARADHCDGAARSYELLFRWSSSFEEAMKVLDSLFAGLEQKLSAAEKDLSTAVLQSPVHGDFASLRYIWSSLAGIRLDKHHFTILDEFQGRAISYCRRIWLAVQYILCDDSPEGHLPEELQQIEGLDTKDLLSYSFRAIHESSNLMRMIAQNARFDRIGGFFAPSWQHFEDIGNLTFEELSNLRHRGAFSTVSQTFTVCCQLVQCNPAYQEGCDGLLKRWYEGALDCIYTQGSTTRRSAGIPAIIVGILASKTNSPSLGDVISKLQEIGRKPAFVSETDGSNLAQVHALNCLKDIFKTSFLADRVEPYLTDCLQLAARSLQSEVWAIRNCGLLLLRSLIDSLFGTNENKLAMEAGWDGRAVRISYHKFETLPSLLIDLLELGKKSAGATLGTQTAEAVFPALDIIRRAGPPEGLLHKLQDIISWYLGSHIWHVREIAARTLCSLLLAPTWLQSIKVLITSPDQRANKLHGALLTVRFLLERLLQVMPDQLSEENITALHKLLVDLSTSSDCLRKCPETQAAYVDILNWMGKANETQPSITIQDSIKTRAQQGSYRGSLALLNIRIGETAVQKALKTMDGKGGDVLYQDLLHALDNDVNAACGMLEAMSSSDLPLTEAGRSRLAMIYIQVCFGTRAPEPRTAALEGFVSLIDILLSSAPEDDVLQSIPEEDSILALWSDLHQKPLNPGLSDAIIRASGPLIAISLVRKQGQIDEGFVQQLFNWGAMMSDAGTADKSFDTRIAAVQTINSLAAVVQFPRDSPVHDASLIHRAHLPWLLALYDALADDDVEVREAAAGATSLVLDLALVPVEAGARLLPWLAARYGDEPDFLMHVAGRMVGHNFGHYSFAMAADVAERKQPTNIKHETEDWVSAETQLLEAMRFDDSLFVIEEHNQYIDEVREAKRWTDVFLSLHTTSKKPCQARDNTVQALAAWTLAGLRTITSGVTKFDGPLGWTSKPEVFAICARVLICASALVNLVRLHGQEQEHDSVQTMEGKAKDRQLYADVAEELKRFRKWGQSNEARIHGLLLTMCGVVV